MAMSRRNVSRLLMIFLCGVCGVFAASPARADEVPDRPAAPAAPPAATRVPDVPTAAKSGAPSAPKPDAEGFVPDSRPANMNTVDESVPAAPLVATAYGFIWLAVLGFVLLTLQRTRRLEQEIAELSERIKNPAGKPAGKPARA
jgi:CcmD family protein